jgi:hypothetical protein
LNNGEQQKYKAEAEKGELTWKPRLNYNAPNVIASGLLTERLAGDAGIKGSGKIL